MDVEEMNNYEKSNKKAYDDEKRLLSIGIDKVAARYWLLENNADLKRKGIFID